MRVRGFVGSWGWLVGRSVGWYEWGRLGGMDGVVGWMADLGVGSDDNRLGHLQNASDGRASFGEARELLLDLGLDIETL